MSDVRYTSEVAAAYAGNRDRYTATNTALFAEVAAAGVAGARVLDLACGDGVYSELLYDRFGAREVIGLDLSTAMVFLARARLEARAAARGTRDAIRIAVADALDLPLSSQSVDAVVANFLFHNLPDAAPAFREVVRVLRPGGCLVATYDQNPLAPGAEYLANTPIPLRLGGVVTVVTRVKLPAEIRANLASSGLIVETYAEHVENPDAEIDASYPHRDVVGLEHVVLRARKAA